MEAKTTSTVDPEEVERFSRIASEWWNPQGKFKPLHVIGPLRIQYILDRIAEIRSAEMQILHSAFPQSASLEGVSLLDIGCGGGLICEPMARLGAQVTGVDASEKNIAVASLHAKQSGLGIDYRCTPVEAMTEMFDVVLALEIVEHVADVEAFVKAACARVKPGGLMVWSTINRTPKSYALAIVGAEYILRWLPIGTHTWKKFLKPHELVNALRGNGIEVLDMTGMVMSPLTFTWRLDKNDLEVNYLLAGRKARHT